jgi:hypothetical protein
MSDYALKYNIIWDNNNNKGFTKEEIEEAYKKEDMCASDAFLLVSILRPEDGSFSICHVSVDGQNENKPISDLDLFKVWSMLSNTISESAPYQWQRDIAKEAFEQVRKIVLSGRNGIESGDE